MHRYLVSIVVVISLAERPAHACTCWPFEKQLDHAQRVFAGTITGVDKHPVDPAACKATPDRCLYEYRYRVTVDAVWKGNIAKQVTVRGTLDDCLHALPHAAATRMVFVLRADTLQLAMCDGTQVASKRRIAQMTKRFGAAKTP